MIDMHADLSPQKIDEFWANVEKTSYCWNWTGKLSTEGCPITKTDRSARRISLVLADKPIISNAHALPLICRNKICVNPDHLVMGDEARFWARVQKLDEANDGCWVWIGNQDKDMYGAFQRRVDSKTINIRAHIYSWELYIGRKVPTDILQVCHKCDHPWCVNPSHLFLGTNQDNVQDKVNKGRQYRGDDHHSAKITEPIVKEIRSLHEHGLSYSALGKKFQLDPSTVSDLVRRLTWKHVP